MTLVEFLIVSSGLIVFVITFIGIGYVLSKFQERYPNLYFYFFVYSAIVYFTFPFLEAQIPLIYEQILMAVFIPVVTHGILNDEINDTFNIDTSLRESTKST